MLFTVVGRISEVPDSFEGAVLVADNWNDYNYLTSFELHIKRRGREADSIGSLRIAHVDMTQAPARTTAWLPTQFQELDEGFFSLSLLDTYYEKLNTFNDDFRTAILTALRDVAYNPEILANIQNLEVFEKSLVRDVPHRRAELERLKLIAHGRERVVDFRWFYAPRQSAAASHLPPMLTFHAMPLSLPPSNVHALIGRNGVGKTHMMNDMAREVASGGIEITQTVSQQAKVAPNVVVVSFSAFDVPMEDSSASPNVTYIGLRHPENRLRLKTSRELSEEFAHSLATARVGARRARWDKMLSILRYPESHLLEDSDGELDALLSEGSDGRFIPAAINLFHPLSSGHKIALLTLTRLAELVTERTVIFIDEPEAHLHPPLLSAFIRAISEFLSEVNGMAVVATHSPVVLQEVPKSCVHKLWRDGDILTAERPQSETYGENVGELTHEVFGLEVASTGFYAALAKQVANGRTYQEILNDFSSLGNEARGLLRILTLNRTTTPE